jgi:hypothetical protein
VKYKVIVVVQMLIDLKKNKTCLKSIKVSLGSATHKKAETV